VKPRWGPTCLALAAASIGAWAIPGHRIGVNAVVVWFLMLAGLMTVARAAMDRWSIAFVVLGGVPVGLAVVRSAPWVVALAFLAAFGSVSLGATRAETWKDIILGPLRVLGRLHRGPAFVLGSLAGRVGQALPPLGPAVRSGLYAGALLCVFGGLFFSADAAFASLASDWLVPELNVSLLPARSFFWIAIVAFAGALASPVPRVEVDGSATATARFVLAPAEWKTGLIVLNLLFLAFVGVQITVLFGGASHVLHTAGLTYAEYARAGFFQLIAVAVLTLGVVAAVVGLGEHEKDRPWFVGLLGSLCVLTLVVLASAWTRMNLYQEVYGFTRLRLLVDLAIYVLAAIFMLVMVVGLLRKGSLMPRAVALVAVVAVVCFGLSNPDARIARRNIERYSSTGNIDLAYLRTLSTDAVPTLMELEHPGAGCVIESIVRRSGQIDSIWAFNLARENARNLPRPVCNS
jgi:hypothetical protein